MTAAPGPATPPGGEDAPFWIAAAQRRLELPFCEHCQRHYWPAVDRCVRCLRPEVSWRACSGRGTLYSFVVYHHAYSDELAAEVPYNVALVELEEGPRLVTRVVGLEQAAPRIGQPLVVDFQELRGVVAPVFRPAGPPGAP